MALDMPNQATPAPVNRSTGPISLGQFGVWLVALVMGVPIAVVLSRLTIPADDIWSHLTDTVLGLYVSNSLLLVLGTTVGSLIVGVGCAWLVASCAFPGRRWMRWLLLAPAALPAYVVAYAYTDLFQFAGPIQTTLRDVFGWRHGDYWFPEIRSMGGAILVMTAVFFPYVYIFTLVAFAAQGDRIMAIARSLGRGPWGAFWFAALPLARPAIIGGLALVIMETLADFGAVQHFSIPTFTTGIYRTWFAMGAPLPAAKLAALLLLAIGLVLMIEAALRGRGHSSGSNSQSVSGMPTLFHLKGWRALFAFTACAVPVLIGFIGPVLTLIALAIRPEGLQALPLMLSAISDTLLLGVLAGLVTVTIALYLARSVGLRGSGGDQLGLLPRAGVRLATLGYAVPGLVLAVGMLAPFGAIDRLLNAIAENWFGVSVGLVFSGTIFTLIYAYCVRFLTVAVKGIEPGLGRLPPSMLQASQSLGVTGWRRMLRVELPILRPSLLAALVFVIVEVVKELPATLVLRPFQIETLALLAYRYASDERLVAAALPSLVIALIGLIPVMILGYVMFGSGQKAAEPATKNSPV
ncbi:MAG: iron ABC transporter permease [Alphaproteobacteria bacterium]|nr:iron ABC transporter permease [Alphaproteobacteria bacterium SS10]